MEKDLAACIIIDCHVGSAAMKTFPDSTRLSCFLYSLNLYGICLYRYIYIFGFIFMYMFHVLNISYISFFCRSCFQVAPCNEVVVRFVVQL